MSSEEGRDVVVDMAENTSLTGTGKKGMLAISDKNGAPSKLPSIVLSRRRRFNLHQALLQKMHLPPKNPSIASPRRRKFNFHQIARDGNMYELEAILASSSMEIAMEQLDELDDKKQSPLHYAARYSHLEMVAKLLQMKAKVDITDTDGMTPLHYAARYGKYSVRERKIWREVSTVSGVLMSLDDPMVSIMSLLIEAGADVNKPDKYKMTPLHHAAMRGNIKVINRLLMEDSTIIANSKDVQHSTPLHIAVTYNNMVAAKMLLSNGADVQAKDEKGQTVLHQAAQEGNVRCVQLAIDYLQEKGMDYVIGLKDNEECTALMLAVGSGNADSVELLLKKDQDGKIANVPNKGGEYPLHWAARTGDLKIAQLLIEYGGEKDQQNLLKQTPLYLTAMSKKESVMKFLIRLKANVDLWDIDGFTPLMIAAAEGHSSCVKQLLAVNAGLFTANQDNQNVVHLAAKCNQTEVLETLLTHPKAKELLNSNDCYDNTPLHLACKNGQIDCVRLLLTKNADIDNKNEDEQSPIHLAAINGHCDVLELLTKKDKNAILDKDENDNTALHLAAGHRQSEALRILLENGAHVQERNSKAWTALDCAADSGATKCAKLLLDFNTPVDPMDKAHNTPLHLAAQAGHHATVKLLLDHKADVTIEDIYGRNALEIAIDKGNRSVANIILECKDWKRAMRKSSVGKDSHGTLVPDTPMRMLIRTFPILAESVFDKCHKVVSNRKDDTKTLTLDYEFIDDTFSLQEVSLDDFKGKKTKFEYGDVNEKDQLVQFYDAYNSNGKVRLENHPLMLMAEQKQKSLLRHPLCIALVSHKWNSYGRIIYFIQLLHYILFLIFLTTYIQITPNMISTIYKCPYNCSVHPNMSEPPSDSGNPKTIISDVNDTGTAILTEQCTELGKLNWLALICKIGVYVTCGLGLISEFFQIFSSGIRYIRWNNLFDLFVYISSILFVVDFSEHGFKECWQWQMGSIMILMAWLNLLGDLQHFTYFGIYVIMFVKIFWTLMKFMGVFLVFIIAFGLGFSMLLLYQPAFSNGGTSILKTTVMMIGEFEYEEIFDNDGNNLPFKPLTIIFFIAFLVIMSIIIVNLLVGLAVDDIQAIQDQAKLTKLSLQVEFALEWERYVPVSLLRHYCGQREYLTSRMKPGWWPSGIITKKGIINRAIEREKELLRQAERENFELTRTVM